MSTSLLQELERAFPPRPLDPRAAFGAAGTTYGSVDAFVADVDGKTWRELTPDLLEAHHDVLPFLAADEIADYLAAFVAATLRERLDGGVARVGIASSTIATLTRHPARAAQFDRRVSRLTAPQARAIARALEALERSATGPFRGDVTHALDSHWRTVVGEGAV